MEQQKSEEGVRVKITDEVLKGTYANRMLVGHTQEEFVLDFINQFPPEALVTARVVISPGHLKRVISALQKNIEIYEGQFGKITEAAEPTESIKVGF